MGPLIGALCGFLVLPGLIVLTIGLAAASEVRDHRFDVLRWLGVPQRTLSSLAILEALFLTTPSFIIAALLWGVFAPRLTSVPFASQAVVRGDLGIPWWLLITLILVSLLVTALLSLMVTTIFGRAKTMSVRPALEQLALSPLRIAPIVLAFCLLLVAEVIRSPLGATLRLWGLVLSIIGVPLILPSVLRMIGAELGQMQSLLLSIVGRGIEWAPSRAARPYTAIAAVIVLSLIASSYIALMRSGVGEPLEQSRGPHAISLSWPDTRAEDFARLEDGLGRGLVLPFDTNGRAITIGASCQELARYLVDIECSPDAPFALAEEGSASLAALTRNYGRDIHLTNKNSMSLTGQRALIIDNDIERVTLDNLVRVTAMQLLPAPNITSPLDFVIRESPLVLWVAAGLLIALIAVAIGSILSMTDRLIANRAQRRHLLVLGFSPNRLKLLEGALVVIPYAIVLLFSFSIGLVMAWLMTRTANFALSWAAMGGILGAALVIGAVSTIAVMLFGIQDIAEPPRDRATGA